MRGVEIENVTLIIPLGFGLGWLIVAIRTGIEQAQKGLVDF